MGYTVRGAVHKFGDNVNTDYINPARYMELTMKEMVAHAMEGVDPEFSRRVRPGDIIVAGGNFGSGSSRETAPLVIKGSGVAVIIARYFARIFYRNAINIGLKALTCEQVDEIRAGDVLEVDPLQGLIQNITTGKLHHCSKIPEHIMELVSDGGLIPHLEKKLGTAGRLGKKKRPARRSENLFPDNQEGRPLGMTIAEKILAAHASLERVEPGQIVNAKVDFMFANDTNAAVVIKEFGNMGAERVFDPSKVAFIPDHFCPNKDLKTAELAKTMREFAKEQRVEHYFEIGRMGIQHCLLPDLGLVLPGDNIIGADSHTCTYGALGAFSVGVGSTDLAGGLALGESWYRVPPTRKFVVHGADYKPWVSAKDLILSIIGAIGVDGALYQVMEFAGEGLERLSMAGRFTLCNMAAEAGSKTAIIAPDDKTLDYVRPRARRPYQLYQSDADAVYEDVMELNAADIDLLVAFPHLPSNTRRVEDAAQVLLDQVVIGSCTNGRLEDLRVAARILKGRKVHAEIRTLVFPGSQQIYLEALREGLIEIFIEAGVAVSTPTCGPCLGGHMGVLAKGEKALCTTNRNFVGRMGHPESEVYLSSPAVAAASAVLGRIAGPEEVMA